MSARDGLAVIDGLFEYLKCMPLAWPNLLKHWKITLPAAKDGRAWGCMCLLIKGESPRTTASLHLLA